MTRNTDFKIEKVLGFSIRVLCDDGIERNIEFSDFIAQRDGYISTNSYDEYDIYYKKNILSDNPFDCLHVPGTYEINFGIQCSGYSIKSTLL